MAAYAGLDLATVHRFLERRPPSPVGPITPQIAAEQPVGIAEMRKPAPDLRGELHAEWKVLRAIQRVVPRHTLEVEQSQPGNGRPIGDSAGHEALGPVSVCTDTVCDSLWP